MGKISENVKKYAIISGFSTTDNNRGTAALGYGSVSFLNEKGYLTADHELVNFRFYIKFWKKQYHKEYHDTITQRGITWKHSLYHVFFLEKLLAEKFQILLPFTRFGRMMKKVEFVAAINGGDGFSDIYGTDTFHLRLPETEVALGLSVPHIVLPQTLGPFQEQVNYDIAKGILQRSQKVYVRDDKFVSELNKMNVPFELTKDLSAFMEPQAWDIDITPNSIGINISGLCYSNKFRTLAGQFAEYPKLIDSIIKHFQSQGKTVYLIPHSYNYSKPETNNDDLEACRFAYNMLEDKRNVILIDKDLISPQVKYVISRMSFFIGTRMHANFAAIYTGVPLFGLAYSYKFAGAFTANGLDGEKQTAMVNNIQEKDIEPIVAKIIDFYKTI